MRVLIPFLFIFLNCFSQVSESEKLTTEIYENLVSNISNNFITAPTLEITLTETNPAKVSNGSIYIEKKLIDLFYDSEDFEALMAYVISHELAHHYLNHGWTKQTGFAFKNDNKNISVSDKMVLIKEMHEEEADLWGGFFSQVSGYNSLAHAKEAINKIYEAYNLPNEIKGYPSLERRIGIIESNITKANKLAKLFETGNISLLFNLYGLAETCFTEILRNNVNSPEIYNNLGIAYFLKAVNSDEKLSRINYPIFIDDNSSIKIKSRNISSDIDPIRLLNLALDKFKKALSLNESYASINLNIAVSEMLIEYLSGTLKKSYLKKLKKSKLINQIKFNELDVLYSNLKSKLSKHKIKRSNTRLTKFSNDIIEVFMFSGRFERKDNPVIFNGYLSNLTIKEKSFSGFEIKDIQDSDNRKRAVFFQVYEKAYINKTVLFLKQNDFVFDRVIKIGKYQYKVDYLNKIALQFENESLLSVISYEEL